MARLRRVARATADNAACPAAVLLPALLAHVWALLPLHTRFACACVCRAWRDAAASPEAWLTVHLRGVPRKRVTNALLTAAATRAGGEMHTLDLGGWPWLLRSLFDEASLAPFVAIHGAALRELRPPRCLGADDVSALLRNAPRLRTLHTDVDCTCDEAHAMLRGEPPFDVSAPSPLRLQHLHVALDGAAPAALITDLEACPFPPTGLSVYDTAFDAPGALVSLLDAVRTMRLRTLGLVECALPANEEVCDALGRLLFSRECVVTRLELASMDSLLSTPEDANRLGVALSCARVLTTLELRMMRVWRSPEVGAAYIGAVALHRTLRTLRIVDSLNNDTGQYAGITLGMLIAYAGCGLRTLDLSGCDLGEHGLRRLLQALPRAQHLRALVVDQLRLLSDSEGDYDDADEYPLSEAFYESVLLPAVRANTSLWRLRVNPREHRGAVGQATRLVKERRLAAGIELADEGIDIGAFTDDDEASGSDTDSTTAWDFAEDSELDLEPEDLSLMTSSLTVLR